MRNWLYGMPALLLILVCFALFAAVVGGTRLLLRRRISEERRTALVDHSGTVLSPVGTVFAFLIGFAITMAWGAVSAGQDSVDAQSAAAQQLSWSSSNISDQAGAQRIQRDLVTYLEQSVTLDWKALASGTYGALPSAKAFSALQDTVHDVSYRAGAAVPEGSAMTTAAAALTAAQSKTVAVAQRSLPGILLTLIAVAGLLLAICFGIASADVERPVLTYAWAFVAALSVAVVLMLDAPFSGSITVSPEPLQVALESIRS